MGAWAAIIGRSSDGAQAAVEDLAKRLCERGLAVAGFAQVPIFNDARETTGWDLLDLATGDRWALARVGPNPTICDLVFDDAALQKARSRVCERAGDVTMLTAGRLELSGQGHWPTIERCLLREQGTVVLQMRPHLLADFVLRLPDPYASLTLPASASTLETFSREVASYLASSR